MDWDSLHGSDADHESQIGEWRVCKFVSYLIPERTFRNEETGNLESCLPRRHDNGQFPRRGWDKLDKYRHRLTGILKRVLSKVCFPDSSLCQQLQRWVYSWFLPYVWCHTEDLVTNSREMSAVSFTWLFWEEWQKIRKWTPHFWCFLRCQTAVLWGSISHNLMIPFSKMIF